ncbi:hypothetical protein [Flavobacterium sp.]|uniref:hypothetical protein n=1 Tax=Flavobacterium sp. TaxID=239 RepID=UPI003D0A435B
MLNYKFKIGTKIQCSNEIPTSLIDSKGYALKFYCTNCQTPNKFLIKPYETGYSIDHLFLENKYISKAELLQNKVVQIPPKGYEYLGELLLDKINALYEICNCANCSKTFILVFGCGELQPGRESLLISGIWNIEKSD